MTPMTLALTSYDSTLRILLERRGTGIRMERSHRRSMTMSNRSFDWQVSPCVAGGANSSCTTYLLVAVRL